MFKTISQKPIVLEYDGTSTSTDSLFSHEWSETARATSPCFLRAALKVAESSLQKKRQRLSSLQVRIHHHWLTTKHQSSTTTIDGCAIIDWLIDGGELVNGGFIMIQVIYQ